MNKTDYVVKTAKGAQEIASRSKKFPHRLRTMLIMIDGTMTVEQVMEAGTKLGAPPDFMGVLEQQGLISFRSPAAQSALLPEGATAAAATEAAHAGDTEADRYRAAQKFMGDTVVDALGFRAFFFTLKLEKCFTRADLAELIDDYSKAITKGSSAEVAEVLVARLRELLR